jgi:hypothetical protein
MGLGSVISGLINSGRSLPTIDVAALFDSIAKAGTDQRRMINELPAELQPLYAQYQASLGKAGTTLQDTTKQIGQDLLTQTKANYDPNSAAVQATLAALKQQDYSTLPGTLNSLKANLAATGGLSTGGAGRALTSAILAPAAQYSQQAANTQAQQLNMQQQNVQQALNKIASLDDATAQQLFGMSTAEAANILQYGRSDLQGQLSQLINQSVNETNQTLSVQGIQANNAYQNAVTRNAQQNALTNDIVGTGVGAIQSGLTSGITGGTGLPAGADVGSADYMRNALANSPL